MRGEKVVVYMPTWRGTLDKKNNAAQCAYIEQMLLELDSRLDDDTVIFAKMHNYVSSASRSTGSATSARLTAGMRRTRF